MCRSPTQCRYLLTIIDFKLQKQGSLSCFGLSEDGACADLFENLSVNSLKVPKCENFHRTDFFLFLHPKASMGRRL
jgi:hypothetical protein